MEDSNLAPITMVSVHGRTAFLTVDRSWTVDRLKKEYAEYYGSTWCGWWMMHCGRCMQSNEKLSDHKIVKGSIVQVQCKSSNRLTQPVELFVTDVLDQKTILVVADVEWTIQRIKKEYASIKGAEWSNCKLFYRGNVLREKRLLTEYQIRDGDDVVLHSAIASVPSTEVSLQRLKRCIIRKRKCEFL